MASILFITREEKRKDFLAQVLGSRYFIITGNGNKERIESLIPLVELVIIDFSSLSWEGLDMISRIKRYSDSATIIGIGREVKEEIVKAARKRGLYEYVDVDRNLTLLPRLVREKIERDMFLSRFEEEKKLFKGQPALSPKSERKIVTSAEREFLEQMSSFLICGYNLDELTNFFLNLIARKFGITRLCLLLKDRVNNIYRIKACLGLADHIKKYVQLHPERGLARWLTREGTVVTRESILNIDLKTAYEIKQEMKLIQSNVVIPLSPQGELIGILGLGPRITGEEMPSEEIKQIFLFSNQAGIAIQNLLYYEEMSYQKNYIENILKEYKSLKKEISDLKRKVQVQEVVGILGRNVSVIGHELRNPIAAIRNAQYFLEKQLPQEVNKNNIKKHLKILRNEIRELSSMVEDILTLSRVKAPLYTCEDINEIIKEVIQAFKEDNPLIEFKLSLGKVPRINMDTREIRQVISNLVRNSCEAITPPGEIEIQTKAKKNGVEITIQDTGCGIPEENMEDIFKPFVSTKSSGMGFGLPTVKRIVEERHRGKIKIESQLGKYTRFTIFLPKGDEK